jgi:hypothetical protein
MRDDFSADTIRKLGERVGLLCSRPDCRAPTKGPHTSGDKAANVGKACHIHAAATGGPRFDASQTEEQRASIDNGIWLCSTCGALIDSDAPRFPADLLRAWKVMAEHESRERIGKPALPTTTASRPGVTLTLDYKKTLITQALHRYALDVRLKNVGTKRIDDWCIEVEFPGLFVSEPGTIIATRVERRPHERLWLFRTEIGNATAGPARRPLRVGEEIDYGFPIAWIATFITTTTGSLPSARNDPCSTRSPRPARSSTGSCSQRWHVRFANFSVSDR